MEKASTEDECVDSGAETGGSDYSRLSSTSSDLSMGELQDPFLVSVHLIADPGEGRILQRAADSILACVHPDLQLFRVSQRQSAELGPARQPALALILFLQEACGGEEEELLALRRALRRPPWRYHHTETVSSRRMLPLSPGSQDFFTLAPGTPLWALRQVHYGREIVRFTVYCQHQNYGDTVRLYRLLLRRRVWQRKEDFCFFLLYSNPRLEIQLSFKRLPPGRRPAVLESALLEVRVRDVGALVPLLPRPCSPISQVRWRTEDYDGNQILLQIAAVAAKLISPERLPNALTRARPEAISLIGSKSALQAPQRPFLTGPSPPRPPSAGAPPTPGHPQGEAEWWAEPRRSSRSGSLASLPHLGSASFRSTCSSPGPSSLRRSSSLVPPCRFSMDALVGAEETDVDTGDRVSPGGGVDLSVVSAY
uniref:Family with sequence similarity 124 member A n=1 Tax=Tetraodon nigroviridis TaxID=99883 RepID=H3C0S8_TETNG